MIEGLRNEDGKRIRKFFKSRDDAQEWLKDRRRELRNQGRAAMGLSDSERVDAVRALEILAPFSATLTEAARSFAERAKLLERTVTFRELVVDLIAAKKADGCSERYRKDLKQRVDAFAEEFGDRPVATIEAREIDDWLRKLEVNPTTRNNFRRNLGVAFSYALSRGYARENPIPRTAEAKEVHGAPGVLRPFEFAALLQFAEPELRPSLAIAGFAGLREAEIARLDWSDIDLAAGHTRVEPEKAKTASRRVVPILPNLAAWLAPHVQKSGAIHVSEYHPQLREARAAAVAALAESKSKAAHLVKWPRNALRHSFVSYRLAAISNTAQVAFEAGHSPTILHRHYKALVTSAEASAWFAIVPATDSSRVVSFAATA